jgi:hypothetical protein
MVVALKVGLNVGFLEKGKGGILGKCVLRVISLLAIVIALHGSQLKVDE